MGISLLYTVEALFNAIPPFVMQVFLAKWKHDEKYYAVKVLQKKVILNRKEVILWSNMTMTLLPLCEFLISY